MTLDIVEPNTGKISRFELHSSRSSPGIAVRLRTVPGASALQIRLREADSLIYAGEVTPSPGEVIEVLVRENPIAVDCSGHPVFRLSPAQCDEPVIVAPHESRSVDVVFLVDGTSLHFTPSPAPGGPARLLSTVEWDQFAGSFTPALAEFGRRFPDGVRTAVLAFGDFPMATVSPSSYLLYPAESERRLQQLGAEGTLQALRRLPPCSGGDFVDALAEGMEACQRAGWWQSARKLVVIIGDSPGYSLIDAADENVRLADAHSRKCDVFEEAIKLHAMGVEIATVLLAAGLEQLQQASNAAGRLVAHTRRQYLELASIPGWALSDRNLDFASFVAEWADWKEPLARGPAPGMIV